MNLSLLRLFHAIDPGDKFWIDEIASEGSESVIEKIENDYYPSKKRSIGRIQERLKRPVSDLVKEIEDAGGKFISQSESEWPHSLNDLISPPIGLIVRGDLPKCNSVSIVDDNAPLWPSYHALPGGHGFEIKSVENRPVDLLR